MPQSALAVRRAAAGESLESSPSIRSDRASWRVDYGEPILVCGSRELYHACNRACDHERQ